MQKKSLVLVLGLVLEGIIIDKKSAAERYFSGASAAQVANPYHRHDGEVHAKVNLYIFAYSFKKNVYVT